MFHYESTQVHSSLVNGKRQTKKNIVKIKNGKGTKAVIVKEGSKTKKSVHKLSPKEIRKIQQNQFIPGLFKPCLRCLENPRMTRRLKRRS